MSPDDGRNEATARRLRFALQAEARSHSLPDDFPRGMAAGLPDRRVRRRRPTLAFVASATALVALVALVALINAQNRPGQGPGVTALTSSAPPLEQSVGLVHFSNDSFSLDYPANWHVIAEDLNARHYEWIPLVVGTGDWMIPCETIAPTLDTLGGFHCGRDVYTVPPGGVVVTLTTWQGPGRPFGPSAPPSAFQLESGLMVTVVDTPMTSIWQVYVPGWLTPLTVEARFADPGGEEARAQVKRLVENLRIRPNPAET